MLNQITSGNSKTLTINALFCLFPISFIAGNLFINLNIFFLFSITFALYYSELKEFKLNLFDKIITLFFIYILFTLAVNYLGSLFDANNFSSMIIKKSFLYIRYYCLYIALRILIFHNQLKLNWFYIVSSFFVIFVCIDLFVQYFFVKDIFGNITLGSTRRLSGVFGEELIAGGYIQRFSIFAIFLPLFLNIKKDLNKYFIIALAVTVILGGLILSGNRMPFFLFLLSIFLIGALSMNKKKFLILCTIVILSLSFIYNNNSNFRNNITKYRAISTALFNVFITKSSSVEIAVVQKKLPYVLEFYAANKMWKENIFFGGGLKSYRINCFMCNSHPHNYYLEFLVDLGLFGFLIMGIFLFYTLYKIYKIRHILKLNSNFDQQTAIFFYILFIEFFPIRSAGSFFSTNNAAFIFFCLALLVSLIEKSENTKI